jgi:hypothetical protein
MSSAPAPPVADATPGGPPPLPPSAEIFGMFQNILVARIVETALEHRLADRLADGPRTAEDVARETGLAPMPLYRVLRSATGLGLFSQLEDGRFTLGRLGDALRECDHMPWVTEMLDQFPQVVATGQTGMQLAFGMELWEFLEQHPEEGARFDKLMTLIHGGERAAVAAAYDFADVGTVVDVGGGNGQLLATLLDAHPHLVGVLFDREAVIGRGSEELARHAGRQRAVGGDFFDSVPTGGDAYALSHILHDWPDDACARILSTCRTAMAPGGRVLIVEMVIPPGDVMHPGKIQDMTMLVANGAGQERTEAEYAELLDKAGFRLERIIPTASAVSVVEAYPR